MNTTQRCESIHSFFDAFLSKGTTLREFVIKYEHAMVHLYRAEHAERFVSIYKKPILKWKSSLEEHAADVYTRNIFNQFQDELMESNKFSKEKLEKSGSSRKYKVINFDNPNEAFVVSLDIESREVLCQCHLFEFQGILCRHVLATFNKKDVAKISEKYILPRWTKKAAEGITIPLFKKNVDKASMVRDLQFNNMISQMRPYLHVSTNTFDTIMDGLDKTFKRVVNLEENQEENEVTMVTIGRAENNVEQPLLANPPITKTKGRRKEDCAESKNGRFRSGFEIGMENSKKPKLQCKNCGQYGHYSSTCGRRKGTDAMENKPTGD